MDCSTSEIWRHKEKFGIGNLFSRRWSALLSVMLILVVMAASVSAATEATVWTDKEDYAPGETVTVYGTGFASGTPVSITITRPDGAKETCDSSPCYYRFTNDLQIADSSGNVVYYYLLNGIEGLYIIDASDGTNTATATFTDGRSITNVKVNTLDQVAVAPSTSVTVAVTVQTSGSDDNWESTRYRIEGGSWTCVNTPDHITDGTYTESFSITAPATLGAYNLDVRAYSDDACTSGETSIYTKNKAILVVAPNPTLSSSCGVDMVLIIDSSNSIDSTELGQMKTAFKGFVDAFLPNTPTQIAVVEFDDKAHLRQDYTSDPTAIKNAIDAAASGGYTNWEDALEESYAQFDNRADKPDVYIFASDGNPNRIGDGPSSATEIVAVAEASLDANQIKTSGVRIITLGIGNELDAANLQAISSADAYYATNFDALAATLADVADELCGGSVVVKKYVDDVPTSGWEFSASVTDGTADPTSGTTDDDGYVTFAIEPSDTTATVDITETIPGGFYFSSASCQDVTGAPVGTSGTGTVTGIPVTSTSQIICNFYNTQGECRTDDDCVSMNQDYCNGTVAIHQTGHCVSGTCQMASSALQCDNGLFCDGQETCDAGNCVNGTAVDCSAYDLFGVGTCDFDPDNLLPTFDYRAQFTSTCDECTDACTTGDETITHTCADANSSDGGPAHPLTFLMTVPPAVTCSAECDGYGDDECLTYINEMNNFCYYNGECNEGCTCTYTGEYCPPAGTVKDGICYYGDQSCTSDGCGLDTAEMGCKNVCDPKIGPIDTTGPAISNMSVQPNPAGPQCSNMVSAIATENCTNVDGAEFYVHSFSETSVCSSEAAITWGAMSATDGAFDSLVEAVQGTLDASGLIDGGSYKFCVRAKNADGYWNGCECRRLEIDDMHPNLIEDSINPVHWTDSYGQWVCADDFNYTAYFCDQNAESCIAAAEYFVKPPQDWDFVTGTGHPMLPVDGAFGESETTCDWAYDTVNNEDYSEGTHQIKSEALDCACNWGKLIYSGPEKFVIDRTPPTVEKIISDPKLKCAYFGDEDEANICAYINQSTVITLNAYDVDNSWDGVYSNDVTIFYRYRFKQNYNDTWGEWSAWVEVNANTTSFSFQEDSIHEVEYYAADRCGNEAEHLFEIDIVDSKPPITTKVIRDPKVACEDGDPNECHYYITQSSQIRLECVDQDPHPVGADYIKYRYQINDGTFTDWMVYTGPFFFGEDSRHTLEYYCVDMLGNSEATQVEVDVVDTQAPDVVKTILNPKIEGNGDPIHYYLNSDSIIQLNCTDGMPHPVGGAVLYWSMYWKMNWGDEWQEIGSGSEDDGYVDFQSLNDSYHQLVYSCEDALGNTFEETVEYDAVDNTPPVTTKRVGSPSVKCSEEDPLGCDYYITQETPIYLDCNDQQPHPVGVSYLEYRYSINDGPFTEWMNYTDGPITYPEDSRHTLEYRCVDLLGNTEATQTEVDVVDTQPPSLLKIVGEPKIPCSDVPGAEECDYYMTTSTPITINCTDVLPHPVGDVTIHYMWELNGEEGKWMDYNGESVTFTYPTDSRHTLYYYCEDALGNSVRAMEVDVVDTLPPVTTKELIGPQVACDPRDPNECHAYITQATQVKLTCVDQDPHPVGADYIKYRYQINDGNYTEWMVYEDPFTYPEDSRHTLEYYCVDRLNNTEETQTEVDVVDTQPPSLVKTVGEPKVECSAEDPTGCHYWVTQNTPIQLDCVDTDPHPVNQVSLWYRIKVDDGEWGKWIDPAEVVVPGAHKTLYFTEDSVHTLQYYCVDALGNSNGTEAEPITQVYRVDTVSPNTNKTYGTPIVWKEETKWITSTTPVTLDSVDGGEICHIGVNTTYYNWTRVDDSFCYRGCEGDIKVLSDVLFDEEVWTEYTGPFTIPEDSCHMIRYYSVDQLGNVEMYKQQCTFVDNLPPVTTKTVGKPSIDCSEGEDCHKWVTNRTEITLECTDQDPHPVGMSYLMYRYSVDAENMTVWMNYTGPIVFQEDSVHYLEYYCVDELGNTEVVQNETDKVDNTPPITEKLILGCHTPCTDEETCDYWVNKDTVFRFNATDGGAICAVGVDYTKYKRDCLGWMTYAGEDISFMMEGAHHLNYYSVDLLGNEEAVNYEVDIVDNTPPRAWVLNPTSGRWYHDGETFSVYVPAADFGHPPSGVATCEMYAIDIHFEDLSSMELVQVISMMGKPYKFSDLLELLGDRYTLVSLGTVPYADGVCRGTATIPNPSGLTDKAYLAIRVTDRSCNEYFDFARGSECEFGEKDCDTILMDIDNAPPFITITREEGLEGPVSTGDYFAVYLQAEDFDSNLFQCSGEITQGLGCSSVEADPVITPTSVEAWLKPGESVDEVKNVTTSSIPITAVDVLFSLDLTGSMGGVTSTTKASSITIMNNVRALVPDSQFGASSFMDYPGCFSGCGYSSCYGDSGYGDYAWALGQDITTDTTAVSTAINALVLGYGVDGPEDYTRPLYEASDSVGFRKGAKKIVVMFGDNIPHDCSFGTGPDPGRDGIVGTADDLVFADVVAGLIEKKISLIYVDSGGASYLWQPVATATGGQYYQLESYSEIPTAISAMIGEQTSTISFVTIDVTPGYEDWVEWTPDNYTDVVGNQTLIFQIKITVPEDTPDGNYTFNIRVDGDGSTLREQNVTIHVSNCSMVEERHFDFPGEILSDRTCKVYGTVPKELNDGSHTLWLYGMDFEYNKGNASTTIIVDNGVPGKMVYSPTPGYYGATIPVKIEMWDDVGVAPETVQYRIYENEGSLDATPLGLLFDTGWLSTTMTEGDNFDGNYTDEFDVVEAGMESGKMYFFRTRGCNALFDGTLPAGSALPDHCTDPVMTIILDLDPPVGPSNVVISGTGITWLPATDALSGMDHYNIYQGTDKSGETKALSYNVTNTTATYYVSAVDKVGNEGTKVQAVPPAEPPTETNEGGGGGGGGGGGSSGGSGGGYSGGSSGGSSGSSGSSGGSSGGAGGGGSGSGPAAPVCQAVGQVCSMTSDCCEGYCSANVCKVVETLGKPASDPIDVLAPELVDVGTFITVNVVHHLDGTPLVGAELDVIAPTGEVVKRTTDENGQVKFTTQETGWYKYEIPGREKGSIVYTYVSGGTVPAPEGASAAPTGGEPVQAPSPTTGLLFGVLAPELAGLLLLLLLVAAYVAYKKYGSGKEE